jgi:hypothetical protein
VFQRIYAYNCSSLSNDYRSKLVFPVSKVRSVVCFVLFKDYHFLFFEDQVSPWFRMNITGLGAHVRASGVENITGKRTVIKPMCLIKN